MANKLKCTRCGGPMNKDGTRGGGRQRYACKDKACGLQTSRAAQHDPNAGDGVSPVISREIAREMKRKSKGAKRYVITAAQNATPVHAPFLAALHSYCEHRGAELIVVPYRYHNATSIWSQAAQSQDWWAEEVIPFLMDKRVELGDHLIVLGDIKTQPTASRPTQGLETMTGARSAVVAHPKLELVSVPTPQSRLPKLITTTGAVTVPNYVDARAGKKGEFHHTFGACVIEVTPSGGFHMRQINALRDGSFHELNYRYTSDGLPEEAPVAALVMGDSHVEFIDQEVVDATFGKGGIVPVLKPGVLVWHDVFDCYARNHHTMKDPFNAIAKYHAGRDSVYNELVRCFRFIEKHTPPDTLNVIVESNHHNHLARWVREADPRADPENAVTWAQTFAMMAGNSHMGANGAFVPDPFAWWGEKLLPEDVLSRTRFLGPDESMTVMGIELGYHGDRGANGARGSIAQFGKIGAKTVIGHGHSPGIRDGVYQTGTNSKLRLEYNHGPSSWLHTDCLIYANGKRSLINIINGEWRAS